MIGLIVGLIIGLITSILPGLGGIVAAMAAGPFGSVAVVAALCTNLFLSTLKDLYTPAATGEPLLSMIISKERSLITTLKKANGSALKRLLNFKGQAALIGAAVGIVVGITKFPILEPGMGNFIPALLAIMVIYYINRDHEIGNLWLLLGYLSLTTVWFISHQKLGIGYPVLTFSVCFFMIPPLLEEEEDDDEEDQEGEEDFHFSFPWVQMPVYLAFLVPGISPELFNANLNNSGRMVTNAFFLSVFSEYLAIGKMHFSPMETAATLEITSVTQNANLWLALGVAAVSIYITPALRPVFRSMNRDKFVKRMSLANLCVLMVFVSGWLAPILIGIGWMLSSRFRKLDLNMQGLLFLGPVVIG